jgi:hypothetical protein
METFEKRLRRYTVEDDLGIFGWLTVYLHNSYMSELWKASDHRLYHCVYLISHAVMQTIAEKMFGKSGRDATMFYLENFVDGADADKKFSLISDDIHDLRNILAHQGYSGLQHRVEYFADDIPEGWKRDAGVVLINPRVYAGQFEEAFAQGAHVRMYRQLPYEERALRKYQYIKQWLGLDRAHPIAQAIRGLERCANIQDVRAQEAVIQRLIFGEYGLT